MICRDVAGVRSASYLQLDGIEFRRRLLWVAAATLRADVAHKDAVEAYHGAR